MIAAPSGAPPPNDVGDLGLLTNTLFSNAPLTASFYGFPHVHEVWRSHTQGIVI